MQTDDRDVQQENDPYWLSNDLKMGIKIIPDFQIVTLYYTSTMSYHIMLYYIILEVASNHPNSSCDASVASSEPLATTWRAADAVVSCEGL